MANKVAIIRIRGLVNIDDQKKKTFELLSLHRKNYCVVKDNKPEVVKMIDKIKDFVTWGEIDENTFKELQEKKGEKTPEGKLKPFFRLHPPIGGFERGGIKKQYKNGGVLGNRKDKIKDLIQKMLK